MKQTAFDLGEPRQNGFEFPKKLSERYEPQRIKDFVGIDGPKRIVESFMKRPRPDAFIFVGPTGCGKTTLALAMCRQMKASLVHIAAQQCDVARVDKLAMDLQYVPTGPFWFLLADEADTMSREAQQQFLSHLDGTAKLQPTWGHAFVVGNIPPVVHVFTCNSLTAFKDRFQGRCKIVHFDPVPQATVAKFLEKVWKREGGRAGLPKEFFLDVADGLGVRDALNRLDLELLRNPTIREVKAALAAKAQKQDDELSQWKSAADSIAAVEQVA